MLSCLRKKLNIFIAEFDVDVGLLDQQQRSRRNNLEISGIPNEISDENLEKDIFVILNNEFKEDTITSTEIDAIYRAEAP